MNEKEMTREEVVKHNLELRKQLQAYKDREDRLRERVYACHGINEYDLLQILNKED